MWVRVLPPELMFEAYLEKTHGLWVWKQTEVFALWVIDPWAKTPTLDRNVYVEQRETGMYTSQELPQWWLPV